MTEVIGREDELKLRNREGVRHEFTKINRELRKIASAEFGIEDFTLYDEDCEEDKDFGLPSGGKVETCGYGFEVTAPAVKIGKGSSHRLTLSTLAHRLFIIHLFQTYCEHSRWRIFLDGWSSHENVSFDPEEFVSYAKNVPGFNFASNVFIRVLMATVGPVVTALYKASISCYPAGVIVKKGADENKNRLQFYTEYIPDHVQLSAANAFLVTSVKTLERLTKQYVRKRFGGVKGIRDNYLRDISYNVGAYNGFHKKVGLRVVQPYELQGEVWWLTDESLTEKILKKGLRTKISVREGRKLKGREVTLQYVFQHWLDFLSDELKKYATPHEIETLESLATGKRRLLLDYDVPPHYYDIGRDYFRTFTRDNPAEYFRKKKRIGLRGWC